MIYHFIHVNFESVFCGKIWDLMISFILYFSLQTLHGSLDASELGFQILVSKQTTTEVQLTNCDINVQLLRGEVSIN
jgi:hypothetical protein